MRKIPKHLEGFVGADENGEFLRLQDSNGSFFKISVKDNCFKVLNEQNEDIFIKQDRSNQICVTDWRVILNPGAGILNLHKAL